MNTSKNSRRERGFTAWWVAAGILLCLFAQLGAIGLTGPDEPRYAWIARAMARTGDWVTPRLYGQPWFEKPILYYWTAAIGFKLHLSAEWAARKRLAPGVTTPAIDALLDRARAAGALAGKVCGAGGGGCLVAIIDPARRSEVGAALTAGGAHVLPFTIERQGLMLTRG